MTQLTQHHFETLNLKRVFKGDTGLIGENFRYAWINNKGQTIFAVIYDEDNELYFMFYALRANNYKIEEKILVDTLEDLKKYLNQFENV